LIGRNRLNLIVSWCGQFLFFVVLHQFSQVVGKWPENQIFPYLIAWVAPEIGHDPTSFYTSDITTLLSGGTVFTTSGSYSVPSNVTTLTIEAIGGGGGGSGGGTGSDSAWAGGGGGGSGALEKITIPATSKELEEEGQLKAEVMVQLQP